MSATNDPQRYAEGAREPITCPRCGQAAWRVYHGPERNHTVEPRAREAASLAVSGIWLRSIGPHIEVLAEVDGEWRVVIVELRDGNISHIVEPSGILSAFTEAKR